MSPCQGTKYVSGHKRVWAQTYMFLLRHDCDHKIITCQAQSCVWAQTCVGTIVCGHKHMYLVWAQTCVGTIMSGHKCVWAQTCLGTNVSGYNRVWGTIVSGHNFVGSSMYGHNCVVSANSYRATRLFCDAAQNSMVCVQTLATLFQ